MNYSEWEKNLPPVIKADSLWTIEAYRLSLFLADISWHDAARLSKDSRTRSLSDRLYRSVGSISTNIEEGYSKQSAKDRTRFYKYALASAREIPGWYDQARHVLGETVSTHRMEMTMRVIRLLIAMVPDQRDDQIEEDGSEYTTQDLQYDEIPFPITPHGCIVTDS